MKDVRFAKFVVWINALIPLALLSWDVGGGRVVNPPEFAVRATGIMTLMFLVLSLAVTPLRLVSGWNWLSHFRRMLGLFAFFYGVLHLLCFQTMQLQGDIFDIINEALEKTFILYGMAALLLMLPLAATSTNRAIKALGAAKWKRLHQLAYVSAILGAIHGYQAFKADKQIPLIFAIALGALLLYRLLVKPFPALRYRRAAPTQA